MIPDFDHETDIRLKTESGETFQCTRMDLAVNRRPVRGIGPDDYEIEGKLVVDADVVGFDIEAVYVDTSTESYSVEDIKHCEIHPHRSFGEEVGMDFVAGTFIESHPLSDMYCEDHGIEIVEGVGCPICMSEVHP